MIRHIDFYSNNVSAKLDNYLNGIQSNKRHIPYIENVISFSEEVIHFNGEYHAKNEELPMSIFMSTYLVENKPYNDETTRRNYRSNSQILERKFYEVEIYKIEHLSIEEYKIYFKVITIFDTLKGFLEKITNNHIYRAASYKRW